VTRVVALARLIVTPIVVVGVIAMLTAMDVSVILVRTHAMVAESAIGSVMIVAEADEIVTMIAMLTVAEIGELIADEVIVVTVVTAAIVTVAIAMVAV